jgi:phage baseplate assembly protein W
MADVPHLAWPLRMDGTSLADVEQDTIDDVRQCVNVLLHTPPGARPLAPDVGIEDLAFAGVDGEVLAAQLEDQEDRATVRIVVAPTDETGEQVAELHVSLAGEDETEPTEEEVDE